MILLQCPSAELSSRSGGRRFGELSALQLQLMGFHVAERSTIDSIILHDESTFCLFVHVGKEKKKRKTGK